MARPLKEINWDVVDNLIEAGCNGIEIAGYFRIQKCTFYDRFEKEYGVSFQNYHSEPQEGGKAKLRSMLYAKALNNKAPGNADLLKFWAKCELGMKEPELTSFLANNQTQIDQSHTVMQQAHRITELESQLGISNGDKPEAE